MMILIIKAKVDEDVKPENHVELNRLLEENISMEELSIYFKLDFEKLKVRVINNYHYYDEKRR